MIRNKNQAARIAALRKRIRKMHAAGMSQRQIGAVEGYAQPSLSYHYRTLGLSRVSRGGRPKSNKIKCVPAIPAVNRSHPAPSRGITVP